MFSLIPLVLTLYRRLLFYTKKVPLPDDLPCRPGPRNPLAHQIRKAFERNRPVTSPRFLTAALKNGYQGLSVLNDAISPTNPRYHEVIAFLQARIREADRSRAAHPYSPAQRRMMKKNIAERSLKQPILKRVEGSPPLPESARGLDLAEARRLLLGEKRFERGRVILEASYHYERAKPTVPGEKLGGSGRRIIPTVDHAFEAVPFLRYKKPQPRVLGTILHSKGVKWRDYIDQVPVYKEELKVMARLEDEWDEQTGEAPQAQGGTYMMFDHKLGETIEVFSFSDANTKAYNALQTKLARLKTDAALRTQALMKIVEEEKALAEQESRKRKNLKRQIYFAKKTSTKPEVFLVKDTPSPLRKKPETGVLGVDVQDNTKRPKSLSAVEQFRRAYTSTTFDEFGTTR